MADFLREYVEALSSRVRSPIMGSIFLVVLLWNWEAFFYLLFGDTSTSVRLRYFNMNTDIWTLLVIPMGIGGLAALVLPWVNLIGAHLVSTPVKLHRKLQADAASDHAVHKLMLKAREEEAMADFNRIREKGLIEAAQRLVEAKAVSPELGQAIEEDRASKGPDDLDGVFTQLGNGRTTGFDELVLMAIGYSRHGVTLSQLMSFDVMKKYLEVHEAIQTPARLESMLKVALSNLREKALVWLNDDAIYQATEEGFKIASSQKEFHSLNGSQA